MSEKPEADEYEDEEADEPVIEDGDVDLDQVNKSWTWPSAGPKGRGPGVAAPRAPARRSTPPSSPVISRTMRSAIRAKSGSRKPRRKPRLS